MSGLYHYYTRLDSKFQILSRQGCADTFNVTKLIYQQLSCAPRIVGNQPENFFLFCFLSLCFALQAFCFNTGCDQDVTEQDGGKSGIAAKGVAR
jgi:hypothetical protein